MNHEFLIKNTNRIAVYATVALTYWVVVFLTITVFDLKIFRERMTETFYLSLLGIFAILGGAMVLNVMANLSKISTALGMQNAVPTDDTKPSRLRVGAAALSLVLVVAVLFVGNEFSVQRKKQLLISAAERLVSENQDSLAMLADYKFSLDYAKKAAGVLKVVQKIDKNFPEVMLVVPESISSKQVFLAFGSREYYDAKAEDQKVSYIFSASQSEREYLSSVFVTGNKNYRFHGEKGSYQLYFPIEISGKRFVLYFSDYQRYGKFGS